MATDKSFNLNLSLEEESAKLYKSFETSVPLEEISWTVGNNHSVILRTKTNVTFNILTLTISNDKNQIVETAEFKKTGNGIYTATSVIAKYLSNAQKIYLGIIYSYYKTNKTGVKYLESKKTEAIKVYLYSSIGSSGLNISQNFNMPGIITDLIKKFESAKAIRNIAIVGGKILRITEINGSVNNFNITQTAEDLGLIVKVKNSNERGGGGKVGTKSSLGGDERGFAGGYNTKTSSGGAIGFNAYSHQGFSGGSGAKAKTVDGIAIGINSLVEPTNGTEDSKRSIAIGTKTVVKPKSPNSVVIGSGAYVRESPYSVVIGGGPGDITNPIKYETNKPDTTTCTVARKCNGGIALGSRAFVRDGEYSIAIGVNASSRGSLDESKLTYSSDNDVAIGSHASCRGKGCISIGQDSKAGTDEYAGTCEAAIKEEQVISKNKLGRTSAVAIGVESWARAHSTIALGKKTKSIQYGCISIGHQAVAGNIKHKTNNRDYSEKIGSRAIAIGYKANATAENSIQLGTGTNGTSGSFQVFNCCVVKNGVVQVDLSKSGATGVLPVAKGGTGARTQRDALKNLGVVSGQYTVQSFDPKNKGKYGNDYTVYFDKSKKPVFKTIPNVTMSLNLGETYDPCTHHVFIKKVTTSGFVFRYNYNGE